MKKVIRILCFIILSALGFTACAQAVPSEPTASKDSGAQTNRPDGSERTETPDKTPTGTPVTADTTEKSTPTPEEPDPVPDYPDCAPDELPESVEIGSVRVQLLSGTLLRVEVKNGDGYEDRPSFTVPTRTGWKKVAWELVDGDGESVVRTAGYDVHVPKNAKNLKDVRVTDSKGRELWRYESLTDSNVYLPSPGDELKSWFFADNPRVIPSENGYSLPEDGTYEKNNGWETQSDAKDVFVFLPHGNYKTFTGDFVRLTGRSEMVSLDLLGYWDSRWYAYSEASALNQIKEYKERGYSIDVLVIDTDWRDTSNGIGYTINEKLFPNMADFLEKAHAEGVTIYFNDHPEPAAGTGSLLDEKEIEYRTKNLKLLLSLGLDYWWYDRNWSVALKPAATGLSIYTTGMYAFQWITEDYYAEIAEDLQNYARRGLIMGNVDGVNNGVITYAPELAAHRYSIQWTGDINTDAYALDQEIKDLIFAGAEMGLPYVSSDLGGHTSEVTNEMYVRWIQYGALSNICRVHCTKPYSRMPWLYGATAEAVTKEYVGMRYRLLPLFYELAHENYTTGLPIMRRLDINYPQYAEASANDEYLLGDYILIAPISGMKEAKIVPELMLSHDGQPGLLGEYYKNVSMRGEPAYTRVDGCIDFDWTTVGPAELGTGENFSIRWTGDITAGNKDVLLRFYADDGIRVFIDGKRVVNGWSVYDQYLFSSVKLKAGTKHSIKVEYFQKGGYAHVNMAYTTKFDDARGVFIPDGEWIDVWTGERVVGPTTVTVDHPLETSPIYVRSGAVIALAENMTNTGEKNWSNLCLDVYPSKNFEASTVIYEDDTETVAYKDGKYRTTDIRMTYTDALTLDIDAAAGSFESDFRAFENRTYTVRIHGRSDFGKLTKITVNGKEADASVIPVTADASPFAYSGGARDGEIYEFSFSANVYEAQQIKAYFENPADDRVNESYDRSAVGFDVNVETISKSALDVTSGADLDYALFGIGGADTAVRKKDGAGLIGDCLSDGGTFIFDDNYQISWKNGDVRGSGRTTNGVASRRNFLVTLKTVEGKTVYTLYIGGWKSMAKLTVRDRAGNVRTVTLGDMRSNYYRKVTIECDSAAASELYIDYAILCGENITFTAVQASEK